MIAIRNKDEIKLLEHAGLIVYKTHELLRKHIKPGITTYELDKLAEEFILSMGATASFKEQNNYPASICASINSEVVHGIPSNRKLKEGDIVSIDIGAKYKGYHSDSAWTYTVGEVSDEAKYLLKHTENALYEGLKQVKPGNKVGDIGYAISNYAKKHNLSVIRELVGHGVGKELHEEPEVPNYGNKNTGDTLKEGMVIAIEPMLNLGSRHILLEEDGWTITTEDNKLSAHFEHTIVITNDGYKILTKE